MKEGDHLEYSGVDGRIILKWILEVWVGEHGLIDLAQNTDRLGGSCECGNDPSCSIKFEECLD